MSLVKPNKSFTSLIDLSIAQNVRLFTWRVTRICILQPHFLITVISNTTLLLALNSAAKYYFLLSCSNAEYDYSAKFFMAAHDQEPPKNQEVTSDSPPAGALFIYKDMSLVKESLFCIEYPAINDE